MIERDIAAELLWHRNHARDGYGISRISQSTLSEATDEILRLREVVTAQRQIIAEQRAQINYETDLCAQIAAKDAQIAALLKVKEAAEAYWELDNPLLHNDLGDLLAAYNKEHPDASE